MNKNNYNRINLIQLAQFQSVKSSWWRKAAAYSAND